MPAPWQEMDRHQPQPSALHARLGSEDADRELVPARDPHRIRLRHRRSYYRPRPGDPPLRLRELQTAGDRLERLRLDTKAVARLLNLCKQRVKAQPMRVASMLA